MISTSSSSRSAWSRRLTVQEAAKRLGIELNEFGFCATDRLDPLSTSRPGVFVAGAFQEPKDIPESVTQASAAASMSMALLAEARNSLVTRKVFPGEHDVTDEEPRIGVFVCHCGRNIGSVVDVERVAAEAGKQLGVVLATHTMYTCASNSLANIKQHDPRAPPQPRRRGVLHAAHPRADLPRDAQGSRPEPVPVRDGQHPRPVLLGALERAGAGHGESHRPGQEEYIEYFEDRAKAPLRAKFEPDTEIGQKGASSGKVSLWD